MKMKIHSWRSWLILSDIVTGGLLGIFAFVVLDFLSAGVFTSIVTLCVLFFALGLVHYFLWGQSIPTRTQTVAPARMRTPLVVEIDDSERTELLHLLEGSLHLRTPRDRREVEEEKSPEHAAVRRRLLDKIRMFGA